MTRRKTVLALLGAGLLAPGMALAFQAFNRFEVYPVSKGVIEVVNRNGSAPKDFWCGAGDYAIRVLRTSATQRIYLVRPVGPAVTVQGRKGVHYALQPPPGVNTTPVLLAMPMFCLSVVFLALVSVLVVLWVDVPRMVENRMRIHFFFYF